MRNQKGITLIALVITIIVMLILVAVTITMAVNGGLFGYARNAAVGTNEAKVQEQTLGTGRATVDGEASLNNATIDQIVTQYTTSE